MMTRWLPLFALLLFGATAAPAFAAKETKSGSKPAPSGDEDEDEEEDPEWDAPPAERGRLADEPGGGDPDEDEDDEEVSAPKPKPAAAPAAPAAEKALDTQGKAALGDHFPLKVIAKDLDAITVELPVIVASKSAEHNGKDWWLSAELFLDNAKVGEARYLVTKAGLADLSPTVIWVRSVVGVKKPAGVAELRVAQLVDGAAPKPLFTRQVAYSL
jgi:hypothetical protein